MDQKFNWDRRILEKYAVSAPRYTSYPTANLFSEDFTEEDYSEACARLNHRISPISVYVHIPFCQRACFYCGCNRTITRSKKKIQEYLEGLYREIARRSDSFSHRRVLQLHWGGGTPNYLDNSQMTELMHELATHFELDGSESRDFSIEIDPRSVEEQSIALIRGLGFNRISLGIQDFDPEVQRAINRIQPYESIRELMQEINRFDFSSVNFDLIYGLPHQNLERMKKTLDQVVGLKPDRIACYNYAHMPDRFPAQRAIASTALPGAEQKLRICELIGKTLTENGYQHIGLDHFALNDDELCRAAETGNLQRNFQGYSRTLAEDLVGIGASAISEVGDCYAQNQKDLNSYLDVSRNAGLPIIKGIRLSKDDRIRKKIIQSICCKLRLDMEEIETEFGISFRRMFSQQLESLKPLERDGLVRWNNSVLEVSYAGRFVLRNICMLFDQYLQSKAPQSFSKVV